MAVANSFLFVGIMTMEPATKSIENGKAHVFPMESAITTAILEGHGNNLNMGQVIKLTRESGKWSDQVLGESWTIKQWSEVCLPVFMFFVPNFCWNSGTRIAATKMKLISSWMCSFLELCVKLFVRIFPHSA